MRKRSILIEIQRLSEGSNGKAWNKKYLKEMHWLENFVNFVNILNEIHHYNNTSSSTEDMFQPSPQSMKPCTYWVPDVFSKDSERQPGLSCCWFTLQMQGHTEQMILMLLMRQCEISLHHSDRHATYNLGTVSLCNFPFSIYSWRQVTDCAES